MKILVADDHPSVVKDVIYELKELYPSADVTGTSDPAEILPLCREKGSRVPDVLTLMRIAKVLGIELNDLTGE